MHQHENKNHTPEEGHPKPDSAAPKHEEPAREPKDGHHGGHHAVHHGHADEGRAKVKELEQKLQDSDKAYAEMLDTARRIKAEYENYRKRSDANLQDRIENDRISLIREFIPVYDNFERAFASWKDGGSAEEWRKGLEMILKQYRQVLEKHGVSQIDPLNQKFDPNEHEALLVKENPDAIHETVAQVLEKGYRLNAKIVRPAKVQVDRPGGTPEKTKEPEETGNNSVQ